jgi:hypothetical protein
MNCRTARKMMIDYMDNHLKQSLVDRFEVHIESCCDCKSLMIDMTGMVNKARRLEHVDPPDELWFSISRKVLNQQLKRKERNPYWNFFIRPLRLTFAVSLMLGITVVFFIFHVGLPTGFQQTNNTDLKAFHHFEEAEQQYKLAIEALNRSMPDFDDELPTGLAAVIKGNLEIIDESIRICQAAIDQHPENPLASEQLIVCYRKKFELLYEIRRVLAQAG